MGTGHRPQVLDVPYWMGAHLVRESSSFLLSLHTPKTQGRISQSRRSQRTQINTYFYSFILLYVMSSDPKELRESG